MDHERLSALLRDVRDGKVGVEAAVKALELLPFVDTGVARVDRHRELRCGFPEVIFCQGKEPDHIGAIAARILEASDRLLATRADGAAYEAIGKVAADAEYVEAARAVVVDRSARERVGLVGVVSAGTADMPVAEEARVTCEVLGSRVQTFYDVGVAGLHRLLSHVEELRKARALVVAAGMEGALASVVGGIVSVPVIAVPTSVGYGASFGGIAALLSMLNSCAAGVSVVNIDNGFGAGYAASLINRASSGTPET
jgi:NCAIR mutase (PurE)-related protein